MEEWKMEDLKVYRDLKDRDLKKEGIFIGEGRYVVERMVCAGCDILSVLCLPDYAGHFMNLAKNKYPVIVKTKDELGRITGFRFHRGILAAARRPRFPGLNAFCSVLPHCASLVVLPFISEAENTGSIVRSASAFFMDGIITGPGCMDPLSRKGIRCSMGAVFEIPVAEYTSHNDAITTLHNHGFHIIGTTPSSLGEPLQDFHFPRNPAVVFGHEADGLPDPWDTACDLYIRIPISARVDSLNVGIAAGIILYELSKKINTSR